MRQCFLLSLCSVDHVTRCKEHADAYWITAVPARWRVRLRAENGDVLTVSTSGWIRPRAEAEDDRANGNYYTIPE